MDIKERAAWADAITTRIYDEMIITEYLPEEACLLMRVLRNLLYKNPKTMEMLIGTGIIEEDYFESLP